MEPVKTDTTIPSYFRTVEGGYKIRQVVNNCLKCIGITLAGAGSGALIGTVILPGIGTILGAVLGAIVGLIIALTTISNQIKEERLLEDKFSQLYQLYNEEATPPPAENSQINPPEMSGLKSQD